MYKIVIVLLIKYCLGSTYYIALRLSINYLKLRIQIQFVVPVKFLVLAAFVAAAISAAVL